MNVFIFGEVQLAEGSGIAVRVLQKARLKWLKQHTDWDLNLGRVAYEKKGLAKILEVVTGGPVPDLELQGLELKCCLEPPEKKPAEKPVLAHVTKFYPNRFLMGVTLPGGELVNIRVKTTVNFKVRMEVPLRRVGETKWELARKLPRYPGRW